MLAILENTQIQFFGNNPDVDLFELKPHKRSWILQSIKKIGDYYLWKYNTRDIQDGQTDNRKI